MARGKFGSADIGAMEIPLHVVEGSIGDTMFKWVNPGRTLDWLRTSHPSSLLPLRLREPFKQVGGQQSKGAQPQHRTVRFSDANGCGKAQEELQD